MIYMLDTNICIYLIQQKSPRLLQRIRRQSPGDIGLSSITVAELRYGVAKSSAVERNRQALERFLLPFGILDFDEIAAITYGQARSTLERAGTPIGPLDNLIGAHALSLGMRLVTNNMREFQRIPGLSVENWT